MDNNFSVFIGGLTFEHPIINAAGHCKRVEEFEPLLRSSVSAINVGSIMPEFRSGYESEYWSTPAFTLNSMRIPCQSMEYYEKYLSAWVQRTQDHNKQLILNIAGFTIDDYEKLVYLAMRCGVKIVEVNFGCPNLVEKGIQKPIFSYDLETMDQILLRICTRSQYSELRFWVKFSPQADPSQIPRMASMVQNYERQIVAVVTTNTFPNGFGFKDNGKHMIDPNNGFGGVSGPPMFPIGMGQVRQWRRALDELVSPIHVIGVGGIDNGRHVLDYVNAGASAVQVGTAYFNQGPKIFERLLWELDGEMEKRQSSKQ